MLIKKIIVTIICISIHFLLYAQANTYAQNQEADKYLFGLGVPKDEQKAFNLYLGAALKGDLQAMNKVGVFYNEGIGTIVNKQQAIYWLLKALQNGFVKANYNLGTLYKDSKIEDQDFDKAFYYFSKGAEAKEQQCIYAKGYMLYKGLGCKQNYEEAFKYFYEGARIGKPTSMYYVGLSFRNGYGISKNIDSAKYWLQKAFINGEKMALQELKSTESEYNNPNLTDQLEILKSKTIVNAKQQLNQAIKIESTIFSNIIEGKYKGYIYKYDWSKKYVVSKIQLDVELTYANGELSGTWEEKDSDKVPFYATLTNSNMIFKNTTYEQLSHYNPTSPISYSFQNAKLQWQKIEDSLTLSGTIQMYNNFANEPQKPQYIFIKKYKSGNSKQQIKLLNDDGTEVKNISRLTVYPNPFNSIINVDFVNNEIQKVLISIHSVDGREIYNNDLGVLTQGTYSIAILPKVQHVAGVYILKIQYGNKTKTVKIVKL
jgi:uncharacterized protein